MKPAFHLSFKITRANSYESKKQIPGKVVGKQRPSTPRGAKIPGRLTWHSIVRKGRELCRVAAESVVLYKTRRGARFGAEPRAAEEKEKSGELLGTLSNRLALQRNGEHHNSDYNFESFCLFPPSFLSSAQHSTNRATSSSSTAESASHSYSDSHPLHSQD